MSPSRFLALVSAAFLLAFAFILALRGLTAFGSWAPLGAGTWIYLWLWYVVFYVGLVLPARPSGQSGGMAPGTWVIVMSAAAICGAAIMTYEFAIVRGYGFSISVNDARIMQVEQASRGYVGSWLGGIGRLLISALLVAWIVATIQWRRTGWGALVVLLGATAAVVAYQSKFEGGRFFLLYLVMAAGFGAMLHIAGDITKDGRMRLDGVRWRHAAPLLLVAAMFAVSMVYSTYTFSSRGEDVAKQIDALIAQGQVGDGGTGPASATGTDHEAEAGADPATEPGTGIPGPNEKLAEIEAAKEAGASPYALSYLQFASYFDIDTTEMQDLETFSGRDYTLAMGWIYATHGLSELDRILRKQEFVQAGGFYQFSQVAQVLSKLAGTDLRYDLRNLPNIGTYVTLPGAMYVDFGYVGGLLSALLLGYLFRWSFVQSVQGSSAGSLFAPLVFVLLAAAPAVSLMSGVWPSFMWGGLIMAVDRMFPRGRSARAAGSNSA